MKLRAYHVEFQSNGNDRFTMKIMGETKNDKEHVIEYSCSWDCVPYALEDLKKLWVTVRQRRQNQIERINQALPIN